MNKKLLFRLVALVAAIMCAWSASAYDFKYGDFYYTLMTDSTVEVTYNTGYNTYSGNATIPELVLYNGKSYTVAGIGAFAFYQCSSLISVKIPNSVTYISGQAFNGCGSLVRVEMGKNCDFYDEYNYGIGAKAFANCPNLTYITCWNKNPCSFFETAEYVNFDQTVFNNATLYVPRGSEATYQSLEGWRLFSHIQEIDTDYNFDFCKDGIYYKYRSGTSNAVMVTFRDEDYNSYSGDITIPAKVTNNGTSYNVTAIDCLAFKDCSYLWSVSLPTSLDSIGRYAFMNCTGLTEIEIPNTVAEMGSAVFQNCTALKSLQFPASLKVINSIMCSNCTALETLIIPSKVTDVYTNAFRYCTALKKVICFPVLVPSMNYQTTFPTEAYNNATLYTVDGAQGYTSPYGYWNNFTTKKPYSELVDAALNVSGAPTIHFNSTGDYPWLVKSEGSRSYAQSGNTSLHSSASSLTAVVTLPASGTLYFDFKAWGESNSTGSTHYDKCIFVVDGTTQFTYGAYCNDWETFAVDLPAGTSSLEWRFSKDGSVNPTGDYFAIDNVRYSVPEAYACYTPSNTTLTFYYDEYRSSRTGTTYDLARWPGWFDDGTYANVTKAVITSSFANARPTSTSLWFYDMANLQSITGMQYLNTSEVTDMSWMFADCEKLASLDVSHFNTAKVTNMSYMFRGCKLLTSLDVSNFNTSKVTSMESMFGGLNALASLDVSNFNTANVDNMSIMFTSCSSLTGLDLSNFNTAKVTDMSHMFKSCSGLTSLDLSSFNTSSVTNMGYMFYGCTALTSLNLSSFNTSKVTYMWMMFFDCLRLRTIYAGDGWSTAAVTASDYMFSYCTNIVGGQGTTYDADHVDKAYAHIDGGPSNPGYLTKFVSLDEALNVAGGNIHFVSTGDYPWTAVQEGNRLYAQSGNTGVHGSVSKMTATVTVDEATTLSFDFKAWGEGTSSYWDYCAFFVDNDELLYYGARDNDWEKFTVELSAGTHTLMWMYSKDSVVNPTGDYFAIDNVAIGSGGLLGDVNDDGVVNITDVTLLINATLNENFGNINTANADMNGDGVINVTDVTMLINVALAN